MTEVCANCRFFKKGHMECHRYPPTVQVSQAWRDPYFCASWPKVRDDDYCGEFTPCGGKPDYEASF